jgi:hypothetical protein
VVAQRVLKRRIGLGDMLQSEILANLQGRGKRVGDKPRILPRPNQCLTGQRFRAPFDIAVELAFVESSARWDQPLDERSESAGVLRAIFGS